MIFWSRNFTENVNVPENWYIAESYICSKILGNLEELKGVDLGNFRYSIPKMQKTSEKAYHRVLAAFLAGERGRFVTREEIRHSLEFWDHLLEKIDKWKPKIYETDMFYANVEHAKDEL